MKVEIIFCAHAPCQCFDDDEPEIPYGMTGRKNVLVPQGDEYEPPDSRPDLKI